MTNPNIMERPHGKGHTKVSPNKASSPSFMKSLNLFYVSIFLASSLHATTRNMFSVLLHADDPPKKAPVKQGKPPMKKATPVKSQNAHLIVGSQEYFEHQAKIKAAEKSQTQATPTISGSAFKQVGKATPKFKATPKQPQQVKDVPSLVNSNNHGVKLTSSVSLNAYLPKPTLTPKQIPTPSLSTKPTVSPQIQTEKLGHIIKLLDPQEYDKVKAFLDPRDLAFVYIMIGERIMRNIIYPLAHDNEQFDLIKSSKAFKTFVEQNYKKAVADLGHLYSEKEIKLAFKFYSLRLRICHSTKFSAANRPSMENIAVQLKVLRAADTHSGIYLNEQEKSAIAQIGGQYKSNSKAGLASFPANRPSSFPNSDQVNQTLALLMIQDELNITELVDLRNMLAHNGGQPKEFGVDADDTIYENMVKHIFAAEPETLNFLLKLSYYEPRELNQ